MDFVIFTHTLIGYMEDAVIENSIHNNARHGVKFCMQLAEFRLYIHTV